MRIVLTGSSGRIGRAIYNALAAADHEVVGIDRAPFGTTAIVGDLVDGELLERAMEGADAVIHTAALHAPHVDAVADQEFERVNVMGTHLVIAAAQAAGVGRIVFTSTTALYGHAVTERGCAWITEETPPKPHTIYHHTKLAAEALLENAADRALHVRVLRMSRSFPEAADRVASYRLHRGIDARDVAAAHVAALDNGGPAFQRYIISGETPFLPTDCRRLAEDAAGLLVERAPKLSQAFAERGWALPATIDRVYDPSAAIEKLDWKPRYGFKEVLAQLDRQSLEVLPVRQ
ncbi:NAD-dependent epimerase/dehydratase family protein [Ensifer adhaerens]|uniref:NAD-dependent epimerase/dehydratase family protein n=1 Tax=Ensifer adhaerens TaxID=106592 RepID=UPI0009901C75|nr:NAD(P)-dependent oxidoreductase [Ensifer adhaerens]